MARKKEDEKKQALKDKKRSPSPLAPKKSGRFASLKVAKRLPASRSPNRKPALNRMTGPQLKQECGRRNLNSKGWDKAKMIEEIKNYDKNPKLKLPPPRPATETKPVTSKKRKVVEATGPYHGMNLAQLRLICAEKRVQSARSIKVTVERLEQKDRELEKSQKRKSRPAEKEHVQNGGNGKKIKPSPPAAIRKDKEAEKKSSMKDDLTSQTPMIDGSKLRAKASCKNPAPNKANELPTSVSKKSQSESKKVPSFGHKLVGSGTDVKNPVDGNMNTHSAKPETSRKLKIVLSKNLVAFDKKTDSSNSSNRQPSSSQTIAEDAITKIPKSRPQIPTLNTTGGTTDTERKAKEEEEKQRKAKERKQKDEIEQGLNIDAEQQRSRQPVLRASDGIRGLLPQQEFHQFNPGFDENGRAGNCLFQAFAAAHPSDLYSGTNWEPVRQRTRDWWQEVMGNRDHQRRNMYSVLNVQAAGPEDGNERESPGTRNAPESLSNQLLRDEAWASLEMLQVLADAFEVEVIVHVPFFIHGALREWQVYGRGTHGNPQIHLVNYQYLRHWTGLSPSDPQLQFVYHLTNPAGQAPVHVAVTGFEERYVMGTIPSPLRQGTAAAQAIIADAPQTGDGSHGADEQHHGDQPTAQRGESNQEWDSSPVLERDRHSAAPASLAENNAPDTVDTTEQQLSPLQDYEFYCEPSPPPPTRELPTTTNSSQLGKTADDYASSSFSTLASPFFTHVQHQQKRRELPEELFRFWDYGPLNPPQVLEPSSQLSRTTPPAGNCGAPTTQAPIERQQPASNDGSFGNDVPIDLRPIIAAHDRLQAALLLDPAQVGNTEPQTTTPNMQDPWQQRQMSDIARAKRMCKAVTNGENPHSRGTRRVITITVEVKRSQGRRVETLTLEDCYPKTRKPRLPSLRMNPTVSARLAEKRNRKHQRKYPESNLIELPKPRLPRQEHRPGDPQTPANQRDSSEETTPSPLQPTWSEILNSGTRPGSLRRRSDYSDSCSMDLESPTSNGGMPLPAGLSGGSCAMDISSPDSPTF